jgi:B-cell receptor-associated protein 31
MSLVWSIIATFLYAEIAVVLFLVLPIASPQRWQRFFKSRFLAMIGRQSYMYFYLLLGVLVIFLLEAIREMRKYSHKDPLAEAMGGLNVEMQHSMRLFRAQRNFYISGFAIFLSLVIRRLVTLISAQAQLLAQSEASMRQAQSATTAARTLMNQQKEAEGEGEAGEKTVSSDVAILWKNSFLTQAVHLKVTDLRQKIVELEKELSRERKDKEAMKSQSESLNKEYDRLTEEYSKLQRKVTITSGSDKDD